MEKKLYENPTIEVEKLEVADVITGSCEDWGGGVVDPFA